MKIQNHNMSSFHEDNINFFKQYNYVCSLRVYKWDENKQTENSPARKINSSKQILFSNM